MVYINKGATYDLRAYCHFNSKDPSIFDVREYVFWCFLMSFDVFWCLGPSQIDPGLIWDDFEIFDFWSFFDVGSSSHACACSPRIFIRIGWKVVKMNQNNTISIENITISIGNWSILMENGLYQWRRQLRSASILSL